VNLEVFEYVSLQDTYEAIRKYFSRPNAVLAKIHGGQCEYRTYDGNKCAVGCLFTDKEYNSFVSDYEGSSVSGLFDDDNAFPKSIAEKLLGKTEEETNRKYSFLEQAQITHDSYARDAEDFVERLDKIAKKYDLVVPA